MDLLCYYSFFIVPQMSSIAQYWDEQNRVLAFGQFTKLKAVWKDKIALWSGITIPTACQSVNLVRNC